MSRRTQNVRLWPPLLAAAACWIAWVLSAHLPVTWRPTDHLYMSLQRGCFALWIWSPEDRPSRGIRDELTVTAYRSQPSAHRPFAWSDGWGYGFGGPFWLPGGVFTMIAVRRYLARTRHCAPIVRRSRRSAAAMAIAAGAACAVFAVTVDHRAEPVFGTAPSLTIENGALVVTQAASRVAPNKVPGSGTVTLIVGTSGAPASPSRGGAFVFDLLPGFTDDPAGWRAAFPLWPVVVLFTCLAYRAVRAARFWGSGMCGGCGYNRSGLSADAICPECGSPPQGTAPIPNA
ncbi:MAG: hypothetical protein QM783_08745 [Phycisphaerales bacterium]